MTAKTPKISHACKHCGKTHRILTDDQCQDRSISERTLSDRVLYRAKRAGWKCAHAGRGTVGVREDGSPIFVTPMSAGWPDWTFAKAGHHLIFMELKKELGVVDPEQQEWLELLNLTGNYAIVVRPSDLREGRVNSIFRDGAPLGGNDSRRAPAKEPG